MTDAVVIDSTTLGLLTNPAAKPLPAAARQWLVDLLMAGRRVIVPEIADYEVRRELVRAKKAVSLGRLNALGFQAEYLPLTTAVMRHAADLWANIRNAGLPTASSQALDGDVILAAQALPLNVPVVVATDNVGHLSRFVPAAPWKTIAP